jgi:protein O-GlcNAc transferase
MSSTPQSVASVAQALALWRSGRHQEAKWMCESLVAVSDDAEALSLLAEICVATGRLPQGISTLRRLARVRPGDAAVLRRLGNALLASGSCAEAVAGYRAALAVEPGNVRAHNNLGQALMRLGSRAEAMASYGRAIELDPGYAIAHNNLGIALFEEGAYEAAVASYKRALELNPSFAEAHNNCGNALLELNRAEEALGCYEQALALKPALVNRGNALQRLKRFEAAVDSYERALQVEPHHAEALSNCASALLALKRPEEALLYCERAVALNPDLAEAHNNLGGALRQLSRLEEATAACERALQLKPAYAAALSNLANIKLAGNSFEEAIACCDRAIALQPDLAEAHKQRGGALLGARRPDEAAQAYARLLEIEPDYKFAPGALLGARLACCDWTDYEETRTTIIQAVEAGKPVVQPFTFLGISDEPALQARCAHTYAADTLPANCRLPWNGARYRHERLRIAYLSADYHQHATAILMAGLFEAHDRQHFETVALSFGPEDSGEMRRRLQHAFDSFIDVRRMSDAQVADLMRSLEIDIAVDLKGYTGDRRPEIVARRPAPIQVNYLGYPGTMSLEAIDYLLADRIVLPAEQQGYFSESVVYLPECYQVNDAGRAIDAHTPTRAEVGLPAAGFVFCCFNNNYKITPGMFDVWVRVLRGVPGSVLWLLEDNPAAARNLRQEADHRGVSAERLVFAPRLPAEQHLARHRLADLFLDTLPYNAHTTSSDALWAGLPVLTCLGAAFPGRVAASLLHAVGLPELVTHSLDEYVARALELASDPAQLGEVRARLAHNRTTHPLFDTARFCRHLEAAYTTMWRRHQEGLPPESFAVSALPVTET